MEFRSRKSPRLPCYNYSNCGAYFVTICTHDRCRSLGRICRDDPGGRPTAVLSPLGQIAADTCQAIAQKHHVVIDSFVVMPDHIHMILFLPDPLPGKTGSQLGKIVGAYKSVVSNQWLKICKENGTIMGKLWQERYYDHIIRNDEDLLNVRAYIDTNPDRWMMKCENE